MQRGITRKWCSSLPESLISLHTGVYKNFSRQFYTEGQTDKQTKRFQCTPHYFVMGDITIKDFNVTKYAMPSLKVPVDTIIVITGLFYLNNILSSSLISTDNEAKPRLLHKHLTFNIYCLNTGHLLQAGHRRLCCYVNKPSLHHLNAFKTLLVFIYMSHQNFKQYAI